MPEITYHDRGAAAIKHLGQARRNMAPLCDWFVVDELTMPELQKAEDELFQLEETMRHALRSLMQAQRKRAAQSAGGELRHEIANLRKSLTDCQEAKRALAP